MRRVPWWCVATVFALAESSIAGETSLQLTSDPGDPIGLGQSHFFTSADGPFQAGINFNSGVTVLFGNATTGTWRMDFAAPFNMPLTPGVYTGAGRFSMRSDDQPGLEVTTGGRFCDFISGDFEVKQLILSPSGEVSSFWATFVQHCEGDAPALTGDVRYNMIPPPPALQIEAPPVASGQTGEPVAFAVSASPSPVTLGAEGLPTGASFVDHGDGTGAFTWTASREQAGSYSVTFLAQDDAGNSVSTSTEVQVVFVNSGPVAVAGGPYRGDAHAAIAFDGSGSSDPDGDGLQYAWDFGDGATGIGAHPTHAYATPGSYTVSLVVSDGELSSAPAQATVTVDAVLMAARAFVMHGDRVTRLRWGKPATCVRLEPVGNAFALTDVVLSSIVMAATSPSGAASSIPAASAGRDRDRDHNGVEEIEACFTTESLRELLGWATGRSAVNVRVQGDLASGERFDAPLTLDIVGLDGPARAHVRCTAEGAATALEFTTASPGRVRVAMYDATGRMVSLAMDQTSAPAGLFQIPVSESSRLTPGVYFYRIETPDGNDGGRFVVLR